MKRLHIFLTLLVVAFLPYSVALFTGQQLGPTEHIQTMVTSDAPKPDYGWDILQADGVLQFLPWRDLVFESWSRGESPMINPYQLAGQPLTANSQSGGFYPPHILFAFVPGSTGFKIILLGVLHALVAGAGLFRLLRNLKVSESGALLGAATFALSQFMVAWAPLASVPSTVAWIPWILAGILAENRKTGFFQVSLATAMMLLAGHLQFAFYGLFAAGLLTIWSLATSRKAAALIPLVAIMVGAAVAFPQVSLALKNSQTSHRKNVPDEVGYEGYSRLVLAPFEALSLVNPKFLGDPSVKNEALGESGARTGFWPMMIKGGANPAESALWISPIALTLALFALLRKRHKETDFPTCAPAVVIILLGVLLAFGSPLNRLLFFQLPGWSATGSPGRAHMLIVLGMCMLAAIGFDGIQMKNDGSKKWLAIALVPLVLLGLGFNVMNMLGGMLAEPGNDGITNLIAATTKPHLPGIAFSALVASIVLLAILSKKLPAYAALPAGLLALTLVGQRPLSGKPLEIPKLDVLPQERVFFVSQNWTMAQTPKAKMPPNLASLARVHDLFGYDSILDKGFVDKLQAALGESPAPPENGNMMIPRIKDGGLFSNKDAGAALHQLGVRDPVFVDSGGALRDTRLEFAGGKSEITYDGYDHQIISCAPGTTQILVRDRFFDGMTTSTPNTTVENQDGWRLIKTDGKQATIRIDYPGRRNVIPVIIGVLILFAGLIATNRKHESIAPTTGTE